MSLEVMKRYLFTANFTLAQTAALKGTHADSPWKRKPFHAAASPPMSPDSVDLGRPPGLIQKNALTGIAAASSGQLSVFPLQREWVRTLDRYVGANLALGPGTTLLGMSGAKTTLCSFDRVTGATQWEFPGPGGGFIDPPAVSKDGTIYAGCHNHATLYAVDGRTGQEKWHHDASSTITSNAVTGKDGSVFFGHQGGVTALSGKSGKKKWHIDLPELINRAAMGPDNTLFLTPGDPAEEPAPLVEIACPGIFNGAVDIQEALLALKECPGLRE